ncbi:MAG: type IV secretory system conjugative DNA transfer family protein [Candidatus Hadarchaeum sp.]
MHKLIKLLIIGTFKLTMWVLIGIGRAFIFFFNELKGIRGLSWGRGQKILGPGDPPPLADRLQDCWDYRGVAEERELTQLFQGTVSLGVYWHPRRGAGRQLFLPAELLYRNCAVIGPPGSGKTEGIIIPWIVGLLSTGYSVVTVDFKGNLFDRLQGVVQQIGVQVWYWNPSDQMRSLSWNWLDEIRDGRDIEASVQSILGRPRPNDPQPFFYERDYRWLRALIGITKKVYGNQAKPRILYELVGDQEAIRDLFRRHLQVRGRAVEIADLLQFSSDEHSKAVSGLLNALHLFKDPSVARVSERSDFCLPSIGRQPTLLVVGASLADARAAEILSSILLNLLFNICRRFSPGGSHTALPLYFILDEAPRLKERINFEEVLSVARAAKVGICLAMQDIAQFGDERQVSAILSNCLTIICLRGISPTSAKYFSERLGQRVDQVLVQSRARGPFDLFGQQGISLQTVTVPVLREREIMYPPFGPYCAVCQVIPVTNKPFLVVLARN